MGILSRLILVKVKGEQWYKEIFISCHIAHYPDSIIIYHCVNVQSERGNNRTNTIGCGAHCHAAVDLFRGDVLP